MNDSKCTRKLIVISDKVGAIFVLKISSIITKSKKLYVKVMFAVTLGSTTLPVVSPIAAVILFP